MSLELLSSGDLITLLGKESLCRLVTLLFCFLIYLVSAALASGNIAPIVSFFLTQTQFKMPSSEGFLIGSTLGVGSWREEGVPDVGVP